MLNFSYCYWIFVILSVLLPSSIEANTSQEDEKRKEAVNSKLEKSHSAVNDGKRNKNMVVCFEDKGGMKVLLAEGDWKVKAAQVPDEDQMDMPAEKNTKDQKDIQPKQKDYYVLPGGKINNGEIDAAAERLQTKFPGKENFSAEELYEEAIPFAVIRELNEETGYTSDSYNPIFVKKFDAVTDNEEAGTADKKKGDELKKDNGKNVKDISVYILQNCRLMRDEEKKGVNFDIKNFDEKKNPETEEIQTQDLNEKIEEKKDEMRKTEWMDMKTALSRLKKSQIEMLKAAIKKNSQMKKAQKKEKKALAKKNPAHIKNQKHEN